MLCSNRNQWGGFEPSLLVNVLISRCRSSLLSIAGWPLLTSKFVLCVYVLGLPLEISLGMCVCVGGGRFYSGFIQDFWLGGRDLLVHQ